MKRFSPIILIFSFFIFLTGVVNADDFPPRPSPPRLVNDFQKILSDSQRETLERKLVAYNDSTSTQIAIVIMGSIGGYDVSDYSFRLAEKWGIGRKHKNNGILILAAMDDREVFIATGYGMEDVIPDAIAKRIVENNIIPNFKQRNFYGGFDEATDIIIGLASGKFTADDVEKGNKDGIILFAVIVIVLIIIFRISFRRRRGYTYSGRGWHYTDGPFIGGGFGGGSWGGGGGGSFGGFGGGSFGGGGAGGKW